MTTTSGTGAIFFWGERSIPYGFLSQWYPCAFTAPSPYPSQPPMTFLTTEQYMMYHKAILMGDKEIADQIMTASTPRKQKALGRKVKGFDHNKWNVEREKIVEEGNWNKFTNAKEANGLDKKLLETGDRDLVEASPFDRIWGIGYAEQDAEANRVKWGENLLGKAIMRVRDRLRKQQDQGEPT